MKTLRNTLMIALIAFSLGFANMYANTVVVNLTSEKAKSGSEEELRKTIINSLSNSAIEESGKVNILFKVNSKKQVEIIAVNGENKTLASSIKNYLSTSSIVVPEAQEDKYFITISVNPVVVTKYDLRGEIAYVLNNSSISESGDVKIVFEVNAEKGVDILNVFGSNASLVYAVKRQFNKSNLYAPKAEEGKYMITAKF